MSPRPPRLLYVVSLFPCWSETFIVRELGALIAAGADVHILSLKAPHEKLVQPDAERLLPRVHHPLTPARGRVASRLSIVGSRNDGSSRLRFNLDNL